MNGLVALRLPAAPHKRVTHPPQARWAMTGLLAVGGAAWAFALAGHPIGTGWAAFALAFAPVIVGGFGFVLLTYGGTVPGVQNDESVRRGSMNRGLAGWLLAFTLLGFYTLLYWHPAPLQGLVRLTDPLSHLLRGRAADSWFLYGFLYCIAVLLMGIRMYYRWRHNRYHIIRTTSVIFFQLGFAFLLPGLLLKFQQPEFYFSYFWPLKYDYLFPSSFNWLVKSGGIGIFMIAWGAVAAIVLTPVLTYFVGKRWYCSWVCGCGGLAETAGDPFRHLSDKRRGAWRFERWSIHLVLVTIVLGTILLWVNVATGGKTLGQASTKFTQIYGFVVGALLSGVVGVGFYPLLGSRVWCRFFCPLAAILGIVQRFFSRFRITTNGGQCISCGNCSTYCEMGIDVRWYAERGKNIVRASCVGCGVCAAVCPRGVLRLENGSTHKDRYDGADKPLAEIAKSLRS
jgi:Pyruvate/2-oxoacid:ferredoxin oxidoreductase delta subunit